VNLKLTIDKKKVNYSMAASIHSRIYIVDQDSDFSQWAVSHLKAPGVELVAFSKGEEAIAAYQKQPADLVLIEVRLEGLSGIDTLKKFRLIDPNSMVILFSALIMNNQMIEAMRLGAYDVLHKEKLPYELRTVVESALRSSEARRATREQTAEVNPQNIQETIIGRSAAMQDVFKMIGRVSRTDAPVMVTGESGCGKELVANAIHKFSARSLKEFVGINITAIPENLMESELFGHEKGAFTGAVVSRVGRFEQCDGGTLFLDEIGDMPLSVQSKLLRVLQEGQFSRVGGNQTIKCDVRILAATHKDLEREVQNGNFREDLFYRLNVVRIHIPPLRERRDDVLVLAEYFLHRQSQRKRGVQMRLTEDALALLVAYDWPGNVRELENTLQRACALCHSDVLLPSDIPIGSSGIRHSGASNTLSRMRDCLSMLMSLSKSAQDVDLMPWIEKELIKIAYKNYGENIDAVAQHLGVSAEVIKGNVSKTVSVKTKVAKAV
jgi:two-component system, NtrC family, nitrogen regulation response regulator GlnG